MPITRSPAASSFPGSVRRPRHAPASDHATRAAFEYRIATTARRPWFGAPYPGDGDADEPADRAVAADAGRRHVDQTTTEPHLRRARAVFGRVGKLQVLHGIRVSFDVAAETAVARRTVLRRAVRRCSPPCATEGRAPSEARRKPRRNCSSNLAEVPGSFRRKIKLGALALLTRGFRARCWRALGGLRERQPEDRCGRGRVFAARKL